MRHDPRLAYLLVNLSTLLWAGNITLGRALRGQVGPLTLTAARVTIAGLLFVLLFARQTTAGRLPAAERRPGRDWPLLLAMALTGVLGFPALLYLALQFTTASNASLINGTGPLMTAMLAAWLLREKLHTPQIVGALVSLAGVVLIIGSNGFGAKRGAAPNLGDLIMLANVALWGLYSVMARVVTRRRSTVSATAFSTWFALPFLIPLALIESGQTPPELSPNLMLAVLYIGVFPAFIAFLAWNEGIRRVGPTRAMAFYNMLPVFGALLGAIFLNEALGVGQVAGGALVIGGGLIGTSLWKFASKA
jgi:drug/metabolite transporter (DMT)-like permease